MKVGFKGRLTSTSMTVNWIEGQFNFSITELFIKLNKWRFKKTLHYTRLKDRHDH